MIGENMKLSAIPARNPDLTLNIYDSLGYVTDPLKGKIRVLNQTGLSVWEHIDGEKTIREIKEKLENEFEKSPSSMETEVIDFLVQLKERSLIYLIEE